MQRFGIHVLYRTGIALGALAVVLAVAGAAVIRSSPARAAYAGVINCTPIVDFYNDYPPSIGVYGQMTCTPKSGTNISGTVCIQKFIPLGNDWTNVYCVPGNTQPNGLWTGGFHVACYADHLATWYYRGWAKWTAQNGDSSITIGPTTDGKHGGTGIPCQNAGTN